MFVGPLIKKIDGALGALGGNEDNIHGLAIAGAPLPDAGTYDTLGVGKKLVQASDADAMGFDAAYDAANKVLVRYHIDEYFRLNPNGVLWLLISESVTLTTLCDKDVGTAGLNQLVIDSMKKVKTLAVDKVLADGYAPDLTNGMDEDVTTAIAKAQELIDAWRDENIFVDGVIIPGLALSLTSSEWGDLRTLASPNVMVVIAQDKDVADLDPHYAPHAAVGTALGNMGVRRVEEDFGSVTIENNPNNNGNPDYPINNVADKLWLRPALSSGKLCKDMTAAEVKLIVGFVDTEVHPGLGFVYADSFPEYPGVFFSKGSACTVATSDFAYYVNTRVWNKAARIALTRLIPFTNGKVEVIDGKIGAETIGEWQESINDSRVGLGSMVTLGYVTKSTVYLDPDQDVFGTGKVTAKLSIVPFGYARAIEGDLGFAIS